MRTFVFSRCQAAALALILSGPAFAQAQRKVRFEYTRQEGAAACPDLAAIQAGVAARLGYEPFDDRASDRLRVTIHQSGRAGRGLEARIEMTDPKGGLKAERRLVSERWDCAELASSVELAVSIAIDPFRLAPALPAPDARAPEPAGARVASRDLEPTQSRPSVQSIGETATASNPGRSLSERVEAGIVWGVGAAPARSLGVTAGAGIRGGNLSLGIEGRADLPASTRLRVDDTSASTALLVASLVPCAHFRNGAACALVTAGALRAAGHGLEAPRQVTLPYAALGVRFALDVPLAWRLSLALHGDLTTPLSESHLRVDNETVWTSPLLAVALGVGLAAAFP